MKVIFDEFFYRVYSSDPASAPGRMEAIVDGLPSHAEMVEPEPATEEQILQAHTDAHVRGIRAQGLYDFAALAAGGAIQTARIALKEPAFGLIRPPGHHASKDSAWGFCFFNNMAIALLTLKQEKLIENALILDIDLHFGDGTVNILGNSDWVRIYNPVENSREEYMEEVEKILSGQAVDIIGISAGFDNHMQDWGGLMATMDYYHIGLMAKKAAVRAGGGCFAILEGGYNHSVLGKNTASLINGMAEPAD
ncbi:MAG: histone deacetylase family protein [Desulfobacteraceae bacterium]|nr:histone deacetylase family protein [Desulfobacteraceae bacterium]